MKEKWHSSNLPSLNRKERRKLLAKMRKEHRDSFSNKNKNISEFLKTTDKMQMKTEKMKLLSKINITDLKGKEEIKNE